MLNNVRDRKKNLILALKNSIFQSPKNCIFPKGLTHTFGQRMSFFFLYLFFVKTRLEIMFNNVIDGKETFFGHKKFNIFKSKKIAFFQRG